MVNKPLIKPYFLGGYVRGGFVDQPLDLNWNPGSGVDRRYPPSKLTASLHLKAWMLKKNDPAQLTAGAFAVRFFGRKSTLQCFFFGFDSQKSARWWFQKFLIFTPTWGNDPNRLIFFKWVETTN